MKWKSVVPNSSTLWNSSGQNTEEGNTEDSLLQGIFQTQGSNPGLPHCRQIFLPAELSGNEQYFRDENYHTFEMISTNRLNLTDEKTIKTTKFDANL